MEREYFKEYSGWLNRDMEYLVFGTEGKLCLVFGPQNGRFYDYEDNGMVEIARPDIEAGRLMLVCVDSIDEQTWSNASGDPAARMELQERWYNYVMKELVPAVRGRYSNYEPMMTTGCSMGAFHAANFFFRNPYEFDTVLSLSGVYSAGFFMGGYMDANTYNNSPIDFLFGMPIDHPYVEQYRKSRIIICVGQGPWEDEMLPQTIRLQQLMLDKNIPAWVDFWGTDVAHDWPWWKKQLRYFLDHILNK